MSSGFSTILIDRVNKTYNRALVRKIAHEEAVNVYRYIQSGIRVPSAMCSAAAVIALIFSSLAGAILVGIAAALNGMLTVLPISITIQSHVDAAVLSGEIASFLEREMSVNFNKSEKFIPVHVATTDKEPLAADSEPLIQTEDEYITYLIQKMDDFEKQVENAPSVPWFVKYTIPPPIELITASLPKAS